MKFSLFTKLCLVTGFGVLFGCSPLQEGRDLGEPASIADAPNPAVVSSGDSIRINAEPLKKTVELGEPVYLAITATNTDSVPVQLLGNLRPGEGLVDVFLIDEKGSKQPLPPLSEIDFEHTTELRQNQAMAAVFPAFFGASGWYFTAPGEYRIAVTLTARTRNGLTTFSSEPVSLTVTPSEAGKALMAADSTEAGKFLLWRSGDHLKAGIRRLLEISRQYPQSALASYLLAAQAQNYSEPFANYLAGKVRAPDCAQADALRKNINWSVLPTNLHIESYTAQAKCHAEKREWKQAREALDAGRKLADSRIEFNGYSNTINEMLERLGNYL